jgi:hypothetical protein
MDGLFGSAILEVAIGLLFLYFLLSIICSSIQEMIAAFLKMRAEDLERGIANLVCDPALFQSVMQHPAITAMGNTDAEHLIVRRLAARRGMAGRPSYISARSFSLALLDNIAPVQDASSSLNTIREKALQLLGTARRVVSQQSADTLDDVQQQVRTTAIARLAAAPQSAGKERVLKKFETSPIAGVREAVSLPASHPARRAVVAAIEDSLGKELYEWARTLPENDVVRRVIVGAVEGKQRLGQFLLNVLERELGPHNSEALIKQLRALAKEIEDATAREIVEAALNGSVSIDHIRSLADAHLPEDLKQRFYRTIDGASQDLTAFRARIEHWYDEAMEHVSGVYKRRAKTWILLIALVITLPVGADSVRFVTTLYASPTTREVLVRNADQAAVSPTPVAGGNSQAQLTAQQAADQLALAGPLFGFADMPAWPARIDQAGTWFVPWAVRVFGSILTAFAVSMGAPFWFDILQKVVNVRSAGKTPSEVATQDRKASEGGET